MKTIKRIFLLALPLFAAAGCSKDGLDYDGTTSGIEGDIRFEIGFTPQTRVATAPDFRSTWEDGDAIGIFAVESGESLTLANAYDGIRNVRLTYSSAADGSWSLDRGVELWFPRGADKVDFYAYYPYDDNSGSPESLDPEAITFNVSTDQRGTTTIDGTDRPNYNLSDLLTAKSDNNGSGWGKGETVTLTFSHALAMVQVAVYGQDFDPDKLSVRLKDMKAEAALDLGATGGPAAVAAGDTQDIEMMLSHEQDSPVKHVFRALVPAQDVAKGRQLFSIVYNGTAYGGSELQDVLELKAGNVHLYSRNIDVRGVFTAKDLAALSKEWNAAADQAAKDEVISKWSVNGTKDGVIYLWADIDMKDVVDFMPIGDRNNPFQGKFDGRGHTIYNLKIVGAYCVGLFGQLLGEVRDVKLKDCRIAGSGNEVGCIAGYNTGTIERCGVNGGSVEGKSYVGGIAGNHDGTMEGCHVNGVIVTGNNDPIGGIAGRNDGTIAGCEVTGGSVEGNGNVGGIAGNNYGTIEDCTVSAANISAKDIYVGGIAGRNYRSIIKGCQVTGGSVEGNGNVGGIAGYNYVTIEDCEVNGASVEGENNVGGIAGNNFEGYIRCCQVTAANISAKDMYVGGIAGNNYGTIEDCTVSAANISAKDIYVGGIAGRNYRSIIKGCQVTGGSVEGNGNVGGIAGYNSQGIIEGCELRGGIVTGKSKVGGIAGWNYGTIEVCMVSVASISAKVNYAGGIVGDHDGTIEGCQVRGGIITGNDRVGSIAGQNHKGYIRCCLATGVTVTGYELVGGIVGKNEKLAMSSAGYVTGCISAPGELNGETKTGVVAGENVGGSFVEVCYFIKDVIANDEAVGEGSSTGCVSFYESEVSGGFFTSGIQDTPIELMNNALSAVGSQWLWKEGNESTGYYPIPYKQ